MMEGSAERREGQRIQIEEREKVILLTIIHHLGHQHHLRHLERELVWLSGSVRPGHLHLHHVYP